MISLFRTLRRTRTSPSCRFMNTFFEKPNSGYNVIYKKVRKQNFIEHVISGFYLLMTETKKWLIEQKDHVLANPYIINRHNEVDIIWQFNGSSCFDEWAVTCDSDYQEGFSKASLTQSSEGKGIFSGTLSTRAPQDGKIRRSGYCNLRAPPHRISFFRERHRDWSRYNFIFLRVRGDGRPYLVNIGNRGLFDLLENDLYTHVMYTRGGPHWQDVKIYFSKFVFGSKGKIQDQQGPIDLAHISDFNITLADMVNGPFKLEIDYIGIGFDWAHFEKCAYEIYKN